MSIARKVLMGAAGAAGGATYVEDVFSTDLYKSTNANADYKVTNNIDNAGEGGLLWYKQRNGSSYHLLWDTERGSNKYIYSNADSAQNTSELLKSFDSDGYTIKTGTTLVDPSRDNVVWNFRKSKGFFDIVTWTGNATANRQISHNLGCVPGCILIKQTSGATENWAVYHRGIGSTKALKLNKNFAADTSIEYFQNTDPTATNFTIGVQPPVNGNGNDYIAYVFAGGASTAATARSVDFDGNDALTSATSSDLSFGTGDYTVEFWFNADAIGDTPLFENRVSGNSSDATGFTLTAHGSTNGVRIWWTGASRINGGGSSLNLKQWHHIAATRSSGTTYLFLDGTLLGKTTDSINVTTTEAHIAGGKYNGGSSLSHYFDGKISNVRIVKGTAVYTSSFKPSYEPLTNITNTKLLCCNNSSTTGSTVAPGTITAVGNPTASSDSPFDDPEGFKFGEEEDQNIIKCGSFVGNTTGTATNRIEVGFEPQWILFKNGTMQRDWFVFDCVRGISTDPTGKDRWIKANEPQQEENPGVTYVDLHSTGFTMTSSVNNYNNETITYMAIRRPDGYVGKPLESGEGTKALSMVYGNTSDPTFTTPFPVDFTFLKRPGAVENWTAAARLIDEKYLHTNLANAEATDTNIVFDYSNGFQQSSGYSSYLSWNWKRHAGFDVVCYNGQTESIKDERHQLNAVPEMIWVKARTGQYAGNANWFVYHKGLNGGTNPHTYNLTLNTSDAESSSGTQYWQRPPTSTHFSHGNTGGTGYTGWTYIAMLFASVEGISKVGYYNGQDSDLTIEFGFQPRFLMVKRVDAAGDWNIYDTTRGLVSGADQELRLNNTSSQTGHEVGDITSTGFTFACGGSHDTCSAGKKFIYYAHA